MISLYCKTCGHLENNHLWLDNVVPRVAHVMICRDCKPVLDPHNFMPDNLKYLEECYEQKENSCIN